MPPGAPTPEWAAASSLGFKDSHATQAFQVPCRPSLSRPLASSSLNWLGPASKSSCESPSCEEDIEPLATLASSWAAAASSSLVRSSSTTDSVLSLSSGPKVSQNSAACSTLP